MLPRRSFLNSLSGFSALTCLSSLWHPLTGRPPTHVGSDRAQSALDFASSDPTLVAGFQWAKQQALAYVRDGDPVGPWYEAALPGRNAFCMRDVSHMSTGAHLLGLAPRTKNMLSKFAENISASKDWCTWWEITGDNNPAPVDYKNDRDFWYDLPANFDVVDACYRQFLWTADRDYLAGVFLDYYEHTMIDYIKRWAPSGDGLLRHHPQDGHRGIATYDEDLQDEVSVGGDLIAAEYAAFKAYSVLQDARGNRDSATKLRERAAYLQHYYNTTWWDAARQSFYDAMGNDGKLHSGVRASTGNSNIEFPLYWGLPSTWGQIEYELNKLFRRLNEAAGKGVVGGVEGRAYLPEIYYAYRLPTLGYASLTYLMSPTLKRREYPEVSYTVIGNLGSGLMGLSPVDEQNFQTCPQLTRDTEWAELRRAPIHGNSVTIRHDGNRKTTLTNESGPTVHWQACFPGVASALLVNGEKTAATISHEAWETSAESKLTRVVGRSRVAVDVAAKETAVVSLPRDA